MASSSSSAAAPTAVGCGEEGPEDAIDSNDGGLFAEGAKVSADEADAALGEHVELQVARKTHPPAEHLKDAHARRRVGDTERDLAVEASRTAQRRVERIGPVRRAEDDDCRLRPGQSTAIVAAVRATADAGEVIHRGEELRDDTPLHLALRRLALRRDRVDLIDEDERRRVLARLSKELADLALGFPRHARHSSGADTRR